MSMRERQRKKLSRWLLHEQWSYFTLLLLVRIEITGAVTVEPDRCICPTESYICKADHDTRIFIDNSDFSDSFSYDIDLSSRKTHTRDGLEVLFSNVTVGEGLANLTAELFVIDIGTWNESIINCRASGGGEEDILVCVTGPASSPTALSLECDSSSVELSFQSPVYGGECVEYYVVTAVSEEEERNASCTATSGEHSHNCSISLQGNASDYNFTVHAVTRVNDSVVFIGNSTTDCCLPFPENVRAVEEECGRVNVSWERGDMMKVNTTISWRGRDGATGYERAGSGDSHLLTLDYSETGPVEIAVTFSSSVCNKTTITHYNESKCGSSTGTPTSSSGDGVTVTDVVQLATDDADQTILYIAVGAGVGLGLVVVAACSVVLVVWLVRLVKRKQGAGPSSSEDIDKGAQGSVRCGPPETAPPALPGSEDTPDVVPPLYADLDTLKKEEPLELVGHTYHVLEGPTSTQDTQTAPALPLYAVVDKSKKKKNRASKSSLDTETEEAII